MATLVFTSHLNGIAPAEAREYDGDTLGDVLAGAFADCPGLDHYILDDQRRIRKHVVIFIDNRQVPHEEGLKAPVTGDSQIFVLQALSGG